MDDPRGMSQEERDHILKCFHEAAPKIIHKKLGELFIYGTGGELTPQELDDFSALFDQQEALFVPGPMYIPGPLLRDINGKKL